MAEFGNRFKAARDLRGLTIEDVAQETRISPRFLRAIESETFAELPGGLFNRGFVRNYASAVGLNPDDMAERYSAMTAEATPTEAAAPTPAPDTRSGREKYVLPSAVGGLVVLILVFYVSTRSAESPGTRPEVRQTEVAATARPTPVPAEGTPLPAPLLSTLAEPKAGDAPDAEDTDVVDPFETEAAVVPVGSSEAEEARVERSTPPESPIDKIAEVVVSPESGALASTRDSTSSLNVRVEVHDPTRMYVELDGEVMYPDITIHPPFFRNYPVNEALELRIGNPAAVSLSVNGHPVASLGPPDQVWAGTITPENAARLTEN